jgi:gamma-glutamyltranspeptidase/glutathione hydrolase/leukotriene-C4 hydrolase
VSDNYPAPGKRPLSSISPVIIEDSEGNFQLALGASGGSRIFPAVFQTILGVDWGLDISEAIEFPRLHDQLFPSLVDIDSGYPDNGIQALVDRGHNVSGEKLCFRVTSNDSLPR